MSLLAVTRVGDWVLLSDAKLAEEEDWHRIVAERVRADSGRRGIA
jgi:hypothetical protein